MNFFIKNFKSNQILTLEEKFRNKLVLLDAKLLKYFWNGRMWEGVWEQPNNYSIGLILSGEKILGFTLWNLLTPDEDEAELLKIGVVEELRGSSAATQLYQTAIASFASKQLKLYLEVGITNLRAIKFYQNLGFAVIAEVNNYYRDGENCFKMALNIDFSHNN